MLELRPYQKEGVEFLLQVRRGLLADDMGLGKTVQALTACHRLEAKRVLIICPATVKRVWRDEICKWFPHDTWKMISGTAAQRLRQLAEPETRFTIINYELLRAEAPSPASHIQDIRSRKWDCILVDEAHRLRNRKSRTYRGIRLLLLQHRECPAFFLTGTPILNRPEEIWPILNLSRPKEYSSFWNWIKKYCDTGPSYWHPRAIVIQGVKDPAKLKQDLSSLVLRRTKEVLPDLPPKIYLHVPVELAEMQRKPYQEMLAFCAALVEDETVEASTVLAQITRLRQICVSPDLLREELPPVIRGAKITALRDILKDIPETEKVVIFSQFAKAIRGILMPVQEIFPCAFFTGEDSQSFRESQLERFRNDPLCRGLLTTIHAGGIGLNLQVASVAIFLDQWWAPAINIQAEDRLHRLGQRRPVTVIILEADGTIEQRVRRILEYKMSLVRDILPETNVVQTIREAILEEGKEWTSGTRRSSR